MRNGTPEANEESAAWLDIVVELAKTILAFCVLSISGQIKIDEV